MDYRQPSSSPRQAATPAAATATEPVQITQGMGGIISKVLAGVLILAALTFIAFYITRAASAVTSDSAIKKTEFQAVFLTNGQVYFGKVSKVDDSYVKLTDIYYLQVTTAASSQTVQPKASDAASQQVSLAKLGGELHGPEDEMFISRSQVLFWENLKNTGKVAQAIASYQTSGSSK